MKDSPVNVLVVEDDRINGFIVKKFLDTLYEVEIAEDGNVALEKANQTSFDLILMDINLGDEELDGTEVMNRLRASGKYDDTPIIATTAYALNGDRERFLEAGFSGYLSKPIKRDVLIETIKEALNLPA